MGDPEGQLGLTPTRLLDLLDGRSANRRTALSQIGVIIGTAQHKPSELVEKINEMIPPPQPEYEGTHLLGLDKWSDEG